MANKEFDRLLSEAEAAAFQGWDFSWIEGRFIEEPPSWNFGDIVNARLSATRRFLDLGTGGGEFLSSLPWLPQMTIATEAYLPNVPVASSRLNPLHVAVVAAEGAPDNDKWRGEGGRLPFRNGSLDLVMSRHEAFSPAEVARVLRPGGFFLTEQLGGNSGHEAEFRHLFGREPGGESWDLAQATNQIEAAGLAVVRGSEEFPSSKFMDVGALAYYLKACPWIIEGFEIGKDRPWLQRIHERILRHGSLLVPGHLYWLEAHKREPRNRSFNRLWPREIRTSVSRMAEGGEAMTRIYRR